ncbi:MAG: hypothetical protein U1E15_09860 [Hyphomicrobiales bacterium]
MSLAYAKPQRSRAAILTLADAPAEARAPLHEAMAAPDRASAPDAGAWIARMSQRNSGSAKPDLP